MNKSEQMADRHRRILKTKYGKEAELQTFEGFNRILPLWAGLFKRSPQLAQSYLVDISSMLSEVTNHAILAGKK